MSDVATEVRAEPGPEKGASLIERLAETGDPVTG